jgi:SAM-dependent methyltransferase
VTPQRDEAVVGPRHRAVAALLAAAGQPAGSGDHGGQDDDGWRAAAVTAALADAVDDGDDDLVLALADSYGSLLMLAPRRVVPAGVELVEVGVVERRRRGAFATPPALAQVLAAHAIPASGGVEGTRVPRVVDPACGTGALLVAALHRLVAVGHCPARALAALHGVDADPVAVQLCRATLAVHARRLGAEVDGARLAAQVVTGDALAGPTPGDDEPAQDGDLVWHAAFADVLDVAGADPEPVTGWRGGFDAVVANPPWERLKVFAREGGCDLAAWGDERSRRSGAARRLRDLGRHPLTAAGEVNAYLPFVETCWRLLAPKGRAALVVPAGIAADRGAARLWQQLLATEALERMHLLDQVALFEQVSARVGVAVVVLRHGVPRGAAGGPATAGLSAAEVIVGVADPAAPPLERAWQLDAATARLVNPNTATLPLFGSARDAELVTAAHRRWPVLRRRDDAGVVVSDPWQLRLVSSLHMTRDSRWFATAPGPHLVPLWEAKHAGLLDPRGGLRGSQRYWVPAGLMADRFPALTGRGWLAVYRNITTTDSPRTLVPCALPLVGVGNSLPLVSAPQLPLLLAVLASLPVDYLVRQKHAGANLNFFKLEQLSLPTPQDYQRPAPWQPERTVGAWMLDAFARAHAWDDGLSALAAELRSLGATVPEASLPLDERRRALADLDAAQAVLLGWTEDDLVHVLASFPALHRRESRGQGPRTAELVTAAFRRLNAG